MKKYLLVLVLISCSSRLCAMGYVGTKALGWLVGKVVSKTLDKLYDKTTESSGGKKVRAWVDGHINSYLDRGEEVKDTKKEDSAIEQLLIENIEQQGLKNSLLSGKFYDVDLDEVIFVIDDKETDVGSQLDILAKGKEELEEVQEEFFFRGRKSQLIKALHVLANQEDLSLFVDILKSYPKITEHVNPFTEIFCKGRSLGVLVDKPNDKNALAIKSLYADAWEQYKKASYASCEDVQRRKAFQKHIKEKGMKYVLEVGGLPDEFYELDLKGITMAVAGEAVDAGKFLDWLVKENIAGAHILKERFYCAGQRPAFIQRITDLAKADHADQLVDFLLAYPLATATIDPCKVLLSTKESLGAYSKKNAVVTKALNEGTIQFAPQVISPVKPQSFSEGRGSGRLVIGSILVGFILGYICAYDTQEDSTAHKEIKV